MNIENDDWLLDEMIREATLAGVYRKAAREAPACRGGWEKMAQKHSDMAANFADELCRRSSGHG